MILLVSSERVDVEYCVFPNKVVDLEFVLDCVSLGVIWGDDLKLSFLSLVPPSHTDSLSS